MVEMTARDIYVSRVESSAPGSEDTIQQVKVGLAIPIYGRHGLSLQYAVFNSGRALYRRPGSMPEGRNIQSLLYIRER